MSELLSEKPSWFDYPSSFLRTVDLRLTNLEPWEVLFDDKLQQRFEGLQERYPSRNLVPFAVRVDNDDVACWDECEPNKVVIVHDYASEGYEKRGEFADFWLWFKSAVDDMSYFE